MARPTNPAILRVANAVAYIARRSAAGKKGENFWPPSGACSFDSSADKNPIEVAYARDLSVD
jgi:hypothetical protein